MDRTGSLSSFPDSLDQFVIKQPYDETKSLGTQSNASIEKAAHVNHMFDACYNIEQYLRFKLGGPVVSHTTDSTSEVYTPTLLMSYMTLTGVISGTTVSLSGTVPSNMGNNPFDDTAFSVSHNLYLGNGTGASSYESYLFNNSSQDTGDYLLTGLNLFSYVLPGTGNSGRDFTFSVTNFPLHSTSTNGLIFSDSLKTNVYQGYESLASRPRWYGNLNGVESVVLSHPSTMQVSWGAYWAGPVDNAAFLTLRSHITDFNTTGVGGWAYPFTQPETANAKIKFGTIQDTQIDLADYDSTVYARVGPAIRMKGSPTSASFYCVALGDVQVNLSDNTQRFKGRVLKIENADLINDHTSTVGSWGSGATVTNLGATYDFSNQSLSYVFQVSGAVVSVWGEDASGGISGRVDYTDGSPLSGVGHSGFFCKSVGLPAYANKAYVLKGPITITPYSSGSGSYEPFEVQLLFVKSTGVNLT